MKIAEALLLRKQLAAKVDQLQNIKKLGDDGIFETKVQRLNVTENVDQVQLQIPKVELKEITREYDHYAAELRKIDASIQKANWQFDVDYKEGKLTS